MWIDTHCHLDAAEFDGAGLQIAADARHRGVSRIVVPAVCRDNFDAVAELGQAGGYTLGIHPLFVPQASDDDVLLLRGRVEAAMADPYFVGIGEIGLDFFVPALCTPEMRQKQEYFYRNQLQIARDFNLPVLLHVRRSVDLIIRQLRLFRLSGGIAHAFNGSEQQATMLMKLGFKLGFGGACTYDRALHLRRLVTHLPLTALVLETDAPDMPPAWLHARHGGETASSSSPDSPEINARCSDLAVSVTRPNSPVQLPAIAAVIAGLRAIPLALLAQQTTQNAFDVLPRLQHKANLLVAPNVMDIPTPLQHSTGGRT